MSRRRAHDIAGTGSAIVSQAQLRNRAGMSRYSVPTGGATTGALRVATAVLTSSDWTADTSGYPDATDLGNVTLYRADAAHNLGVTHATIISLQNVSGLHIDAQLQFQTNEDPASPGNLHYNSIRLWISSDAAPAADIKLIIIG